MSDFVSEYSIRKGIWRHYSGTEFEVLCVAKSADFYENSSVVVYRGVRTGEIYYRSVENFLGSETRDGFDTLRFTYVGPAE